MSLMKERTIVTQATNPKINPPLILHNLKAMYVVDWLEEMSTEGKHKFSNDLYNAITLISAIRDRLKGKEVKWQLDAK